MPVANSHVDLVVPADKISDFTELTVSMTTEVMHENLGASIDAETVPFVYEGKQLNDASDFQLLYCVLR